MLEPWKEEVASKEQKKTKKLVMGGVEGGGMK